MAQINGLVELLNTLLLSYVDNTTMANKTTLTHIQNCLQDSKDTLEFLQLELQLQQEEIHYKLIHVQNNLLCDSFQQPSHNDATLEEHNQISGSTLEEKENEDDIFHTHVSLILSISIIRPWEEIVHNKHKIGLGCNKQVTFQILDYSKPIQFQSVGFLHESSSSFSLVH